MSASKGEHRCDGTTLHYPWWRVKLLVDVLAEDETAVDYLLAQWGIDGEGMDYPSKVKHLARAALEEARSRQREIKRKNGDPLVWLAESGHPANK